MKIFMIAAMSLIASNLPVSAQTECEKYAEFGRGVMSARQMGRPMDEIMQTFMAGAGGVPEMEAIVRGTVMAAYQVPRFNTAQNKRLAINDYGDEMMMACLTAEDTRAD